MKAEDRTRQEIISKLTQMQRQLSKQAALKAEIELAKETLQELEDKYKALRNSSHVCIYIHDFEGKFLDANQAALSLLGYERKDISSLDLSALLAEGQLADAMKSLRELEQRGAQAKPQVYRLRKKGGGQVWVEAESGVLYRKGKPHAVQVTAVDITEHRRVEQELERHRERLEALVEERTAELENIVQQLKGKLEEQKVEEETLRQSETRYRELVQEARGAPKEAKKKGPQTQRFQAQKLNALESLAGKVGHDFEELLTSIQQRIDLALGKIDQGSPLYRDLKHIEDVSMGAANLVHKLLLFGGQQPMEFVTVSPNRTVEILSKMLNRLIGKDIALTTKFDPDLWSVKADVSSIEQVIVNLAMNARDAMPEGGELEIQTENVDLHEDSCGDVPDARPGKFVCLSVTDTGIGMGKKTMNRIFEPFFSTKRQEGSAGLGLSVAYGIIKQHKGWIEVHSETGRGTSLKVFLPAHIVKQGDENKPQRETRRAQGAGQRILLVENEGAVRGVVARELDEEGYVVFEARTAEEALEIFEREQGAFHLVVADIVLPKENGLQLADRLRSRKPELSILLTSSHATDKSRWPVIRKRGFHFLSKPFTSAELFGAIGEIIGQEG